MPLKLNLGCGTDKREGYINVDVREEVQPDLVIDLEREGLKRWVDNSVDEILMKDFLEHLSWRRVRWFLRECHRVLKPDGRVFIQAPDLQAIIAKVPSDWERLSYWIMGGQNHHANVHKTVFTRDELRKLLEEEGFRVERCESDGGTNIMLEARKG